MKGFIIKIFRIIKDEASFALITVALGIGFFIGVLAEKRTTDDRIFKMQLECFKRGVGDFFYTDEQGNMEFRWRVK
jgi:hypothetical protein